MKTIKYFLVLIVLGWSLALSHTVAQTTCKATFPTNGKAASLMLSFENVMANYLDTVISVEVASNVDFKVTPMVSWIKVVKFKDNYLYLKTSLNELETSRTGTVQLTDLAGVVLKTFSLTQAPNNAVSYIKGDYKIKVSSGTATDAQSGEDITKSFDGDYTTMYHSSWGGGTLPVTLTYNFTGVSRIDYLVYNPRISGGSNGNFDQITVSYKLAGAANYVTLGSFKLNGASTAYKIDFPGGIINPTNVRFVVTSGTGGFASCSEMEFYQYYSMSSAALTLFQDAICSQLKPEITDADIEKEVNPFLKKLAKAIKAGTYNTEFRVNEFEAFPTLNQTSDWMKTSSYNSFENPTGILFRTGDELVIFVENTGSEAVSLTIKNQVPGGSGNTTYPLKNGVNKIKAANDGHGYFNYYTTNWATAPNVKVHFALGSVTGYFDLEKFKKPDGTYDKTTAALAYKRILAGATSTMFDVISKRHHACYPTAGFRAKAPNGLDGVNFALSYDSIVYRQHEIMGLVKYNKEPKNRMYTRSVASGMFADGLGAGIPNATSYSEITPRTIGWWGIGHELGHVNQVRPAMKWVSVSEVTNNIYSSYVEHKIGNGPWMKSIGATAYYRLEHESHGTNEIMTGAGGRFNAYLNYGIKDGGKWLMTEGPDYFNQVPFGTPVRRNYDHFVKLCPFWQLTLYFKEAGVRPDFWPQIFEMARTINTAGMTNGDLQLNFMRTAIDSTKLNLVPFFQKVGMLREYNDYLEDYSPGQMTITGEQCEDLVAYAAKYPALETPVLYYISAQNWTIYRDKLALSVDFKSPGVATNSVFSATANTVLMYHNSTNAAQNNVRNVVAFETYDANNVLLRITMRAFKDASNRTTTVLYPKGSARIDAVGWDGTRTTVYNIPN